MPPPDATSEAGGCEQDPLICQSGEAPVGATDEQCTNIDDLPYPVDPDTPVSSDAETAVSDTSTAGIDPTPAPEPSYLCYIATASGPQGNPTGGGGAAPETAPEQLPRTGPAPLLESVAIGSWLLLLGVLAAIAGRRAARG